MVINSANSISFHAKAVVVVVQLNLLGSSIDSDTSTITVLQTS